MAKKKTYEDNIAEIDEIIEKLESGELTLDESIKEYEKSMKLIEKCGSMLEEAEGKVKKITLKNGEILEEDFE